jgi:hypothetical protein
MQEVQDPKIAKIKTIYELVVKGHLDHLSSFKK